jgi:hypothetical protein
VASEGLRGCSSPRVLRVGRFKPTRRLSVTCMTRRRHREPRNHGWRNQESFKEHATSSQICFLAVSHVSFQCVAIIEFSPSRILLFYILSILVIGLNGVYLFLDRRNVVLTSSVPWDYPNLSNKSTTTSPFTIVFKQAGSSMFLVMRFYTVVVNCVSAFAASFMNTVILTSVLSAGNHALFAGTRVLYGK